MLTTNVPEIQRTNLASTVLSLKVSFQSFTIESLFIFGGFLRVAPNIKFMTDTDKILSDTDKYMADIKILYFFHKKRVLKTKINHSRCYNLGK